MDRFRQVKVAMVDQHALFTECLGIVLQQERYAYRAVPMPQGVGQTGKVLAELMAMRPDVLLVNVDLGPECDGTALIAPLARASFTAVVVVTESEDESRWGQCLAQGARIVLPKSASLRSVVSVVRRVSQGQPVLERSERDRLIAVHRRQIRQNHVELGRLHDLSPQEGEILRHLMAGRTVGEIAALRVVSVATVRTQVKAILAKLNVSSQLAAVAVAHRAGWESHSLPIAA